MEEQEQKPLEPVLTIREPMSPARRAQLRAEMARVDAILAGVPGGNRRTRRAAKAGFKKLDPARREAARLEAYERSAALTPEDREMLRGMQSGLASALVG